MFFSAMLSRFYLDTYIIPADNRKYVSFAEKKTVELNKISDEFCRFKRAVIYATVPLTII